MLNIIRQTINGLNIDILKIDKDCFILNKYELGFSQNVDVIYIIFHTTFIFGIT